MSSNPKSSVKADLSRTFAAFADETGKAGERSEKDAVGNAAFAVERARAKRREQHDAQDLQSVRVGSQPCGKGIRLLFEKIGRSKALFCGKLFLFGKSRIGIAKGERYVFGHADFAAKLCQFVIHILSPC